MQCTNILKSNWQKNNYNRVSQKVNMVNEMIMLCIFEDKKKAIDGGRYQILESVWKGFLLIERRLHGRQIIQFSIATKQIPQNKIIVLYVWILWIRN